MVFPIVVAQTTSLYRQHNILVLYGQCSWLTNIKHRLLQAWWTHWLGISDWMLKGKFYTLIVLISLQCFPTHYKVQYVRFGAGNCLALARRQAIHCTKFTYCVKQYLKQCWPIPLTHMYVNVPRFFTSISRECRIALFCLYEFGLHNCMLKL